MNGTIAMIGDYDDESRTYAVMILVDEAQVDAADFGEGDNVTICKDDEITA